jgi:hypothetical protein
MRIKMDVPGRELPARESSLRNSTLDRLGRYEPSCRWLL